MDELDMTSEEEEEEEEAEGETEGDEMEDEMTDVWSKSAVVVFALRRFWFLPQCRACVKPQGWKTSPL